MKRWVPALLILFVGTALLFLLWLVLAPRKATPVKAFEREQPKEVATAVAPSPVATEELPAATGETNAPINEDIVPGGAKPGQSRVSLETAAGPEIGPGLTPGIVLENMRSAIRDYGARFGGNPFGNNREITAKLNGGNPKQVVFLKPEDGMRLNERGELIDNWGTPFFFHQISGSEMEIRSAGPDRKMWTRDDLVIK